MRVTFELFPSPLVGEGSGGGEDRTSSPHPKLPPLRGEGVLTSPCQRGKGTEASPGRTAQNSGVYLLYGGLLHLVRWE
jgi:hypothetical protein